MSDIQRYILSPNPKLELADGCGKWCIYSDHIRDKAQAIEAKDKEIKNLKGQLGFKTLGIDKQAVIIEAKDKLRPHLINRFQIMHNQPKLLRPAEVSKLFGVCKATLWRWQKNKDFPKPIKIGGRAVAYDLKELNAFIEKRKEVANHG